MKEQSEAEFQKTVISLAKLYRWRVMHTQPAQIRPGRWITPNTGHQGFPDLVMCNPSGLIFVELKTNTGKVSLAQKLWHDCLTEAGQEIYVWRPSDLYEISTRLARTTK